jgi:ABC-type protease/lipase transport system fused ATPase/permease subunit
MRFAPGARPVLSAVTFTLEAGETLGIIGPSGAGKSSLARLLVGISTPTLGSVRLDGAEVSQWPQAELGPYLGYLPQEVELLGGTVAQNICRFGSATGNAVVAAAKLVGAHDMILKLPQGYETPIEDGGRNISGGQRQRLGLARAVFGDPRLIVLDEPDANLDADGEATLRGALAMLKQRGCTVIVITHKPMLLGAADKLMLLQDGRVSLFGDSASVMADLAARASKRPARSPRVATSPTEIGNAKARLVT